MIIRRNFILYCFVAEDCALSKKVDLNKKYILSNLSFYWINQHIEISQISNTILKRNRSVIDIIRRLICKTSIWLDTNVTRDSRSLRNKTKHFYNGSNLYMYTRGIISNKKAISEDKRLTLLAQKVSFTKSAPFKWIDRHIRARVFLFSP